MFKLFTAISNISQLKHLVESRKNNDNMQKSLKCAYYVRPTYRQNKCIKHIITEEIRNMQKSHSTLLGWSFGYGEKELQIENSNISFIFC